jgi:hypothetical protein
MKIQFSDCIITVDLSGGSSIVVEAPHAEIEKSKFPHRQSTTEIGSEGRGPGSIVELSGHNLILHSSDLQVKPIVGNKAVEVIEDATYKASQLQVHFRVLSANELEKLPQPSLEAHITHVSCTFVVQELYNK